MTKFKLRLAFFVGVLVLLVTTLGYIRMNSKLAIKTTLYSQWYSTFIVQKGSQAYVKTNDDKQEDIVFSESQGYGMLITAEAALIGQAKKEDFEKLFSYYLDHRLDGIELMSWRQSITTEGGEIEGQNATDGDIYIAYALIKAAEAWPEEEERYLVQAKNILSDLLKYNFNPETDTLTVGNWATQGSPAYYLMRTSDVLPRQFEAFERITGDTVWSRISESMLAKMRLISQQEETGLIPDFIWLESRGEEVRVTSPNDIASPHDGDYYYEACRIPYNLAQTEGEISQEILNKMMVFFMEQDEIYAGYQLDGTPLNDYQTPSFTAPITYAATTNPQFKKLALRHRDIFLNDIRQENYYEATLTTLAALEGF